MSQANIEAAVKQLRKSARGTQALDHLLEFLKGPGLSLDGDNQSAIHTLLFAAWRGYPGTVLEVIQYHRED